MAEIEPNKVGERLWSSRVTQKKRHEPVQFIRLQMMLRLFSIHPVTIKPVAL